MGGKLLRQPRMNRIRLGRHQQAGGVLVQPVHDPRPLDAADPGQAAAAMVQQGIDQRAPLVARRGVHHHSGRFVDDNQMLILMDDIERDILRNWRSFNRRRHHHLDLVAGVQFFASLHHRLLVDADPSVCNERLKSRPRHIRRLAGQKSVQPRTAFVMRDHKSQCLFAMLCHGRDLKAMDAKVKATPDTPPPLSPQERLLKNIVIGMGILFIIGLAALAVAIIMKEPARERAVNGKERWATPLLAQVPPGSMVQKMALDGNRLVVHIRHPDGSGEMLIFNLRKKALTGRIKIMAR